MREYRVWRKDEERSLRKGVTKHGTGAWEMIRTDPEFADTLYDAIYFHELSSFCLDCSPYPR